MGYPLVVLMLVFVLLVPRVVWWGLLVLFFFVIDAVESFWWDLGLIVTLGICHLDEARWVCGGGKVVLGLGRLTSFLWDQLAG